MHHLKTLTFPDGRSLEIHSDDDPESPREWDNLGTMVCFHQRNNFGDEAEGLKGHGYRAEDFNGWDALETQIQEDNPDCVILPLYLYSHSGDTINTTGFSCPWDSGQLGFIFITREKINEEYGGHGGRTDEEIEGYLRNEVETYDTYIRGDIWGFIARDKPCKECDGEGKELDDGSCWGFFGDDPADNGMIDHFDKEMAAAIKASEFVEVCH